MAEKTFQVTLPRIEAEESIPFQVPFGKGYFIKEVDGDYTVIATAKDIPSFVKLTGMILFHAIKMMKV